MKKCFILSAILLAFLTLFAEGTPKGAHTCLAYAKAMFPDYKIGNVNVWSVIDPFNQLDVNFIPNWFDHFEFADDFSNYDEEFLKEHGGRAGTLVYLRDGVYRTGCSGTLIDKNHFITAGHCAGTENVGVLFGYQMEDRGGNNNFTGYPRVSLEGYLDDNGNYRYYGETGSEYLSFMEHPAYFPIDKDIQYGYNEDRAVENGWANVGWISMDDNVPKPAETMTWPNDDPAGEKLGKIDYAIYKLESKIDFSQANGTLLKPPSDWYDPWRWDSENNQSSQNTISTNLVLPWILPDNTNGFRGWTRVRTAVPKEGSALNIIGFPGVASFGTYNGLKIVNGGSVVNGKGRGLSFSYEEDILIFQDADLLPGNSGSSVIDSYGRLAGVAVWTDCAPGGTSAWDQILLNILQDYRELIRDAKIMRHLCGKSAGLLK